MNSRYIIIRRFIGKKVSGYFEYYDKLVDDYKALNVLWRAVYNLYFSNPECKFVEGFIVDMNIYKDLHRIKNLQERFYKLAYEYNYKSKEYTGKIIHFKLSEETNYNLLVSTGLLPEIYIKLLPSDNKFPVKITNIGLDTLNKINPFKLIWLSYNKKIRKIVKPEFDVINQPLIIIVFRSEGFIKTTFINKLELGNIVKYLFDQYYNFGFTRMFIMTRDLYINFHRDVIMRDVTNIYVRGREIISEPDSFCRFLWMAVTSFKRILIYSFNSKITLMRVNDVYDVDLTITSDNFFRMIDCLKEVIESE